MTDVILTVDSGNSTHKPPYATMQSMKRDLPENSLYDAFLLFVGVHFSITLFSLLSSRLFPVPPPHFQNNEIIILAETGFLILYLSIPVLRKKLGKIYLPLALLIATLGPVINQIVNLDGAMRDDLAFAGATIGQLQIIITLFVPLLLISWQYRYRIVVVYCLFLAAVDLVTFAIISSQGSVQIWFQSSIVIFRTAIFLFVALIINRLVSAQRAQNQLLTEANRQLADHASTLEQLTISRERNRLAREFHDTLAHTLSALAVQLEAVRSLWSSNPDQAQTMLDQSLDMTRSGLNDTRRAIKSLRAAPLEDLGLCQSISSMARTAAEHDNSELDLRIPADLPKIHPNVEHAVFRIAREALHNITEHANAKHIRVILEPDRENWLLTIQDDGTGFDPQETDQDAHFGIRGMREYAEAIHAEFSLQSAPKQGTLVQLRFKEENGQNSYL